MSGLVLSTGLRAHGLRGVSRTQDSEGSQLQSGTPREAEAHGRVFDGFLPVRNLALLAWTSGAWHGSGTLHGGVQTALWSPGASWARVGNPERQVGMPWAWGSAAPASGVQAGCALGRAVSQH